MSWEDILARIVLTIAVLILVAESIVFFVALATLA